ncbi:MAG: hypothetical protein ACLQT6_02600 [Desulfomonilaceae bacterium]
MFIECTEENGYYDKPVAWLAVATSVDCMLVSRYEGKIDHKPGKPWYDEADEVYKVIVMADCGEGAFMEGTELLEKWIEDEPWRNLE